MECVLGKWMEQEQPSQILKGSYLILPWNDTLPFDSPLSKCLSGHESWRSVEVPCTRKISWRCGGCVAPEDTIPCRYSSIFINDGLQRICWFGVIFYLAAMSFSLMRSVNWLNSRVLLLQLSQAIYQWDDHTLKVLVTKELLKVVPSYMSFRLWILKKLCITMSSCLV
jgi:hypothetical protein